MADASAPPAESGTPSGINLQVVSPSANVRQPLLFPGVAPSTTVRQLKEKIRDAVASRPADDQQRLIHRGRLLARDDETLDNILGAEAVRSGDQQTLHLVLRDLSEHHPAPNQATPLRGQSPAPGILPGAQHRTQQTPRPQQPPHLHHHHHAHQHTHAAHAFPPGNRPPTAPIIQMPPFIGMPPMPFQFNGPFNPVGADPAVHEQLANEAQRMMAHMMNPHQQRAATPVGGARASSNPPPQARDPAQIAAQLASQLAQNAAQQEALAHHAEHITNLLNNPVTNQPNRPAGVSQQFVNQGTNVLHQGQRLMAQHIVDQGQRERAAAGLHGMQDSGSPNAQGAARNASGRSSPAVGQPVNVREMVMPNGHVIRVTTTANGQVVTTHTGQPLQAIPGRPPHIPGTSHTLNEIQRNLELNMAAGAAPAIIPSANAPIQPIAPGVTTSIFQNPSRQGSRTATPDPLHRAQNQGSSPMPASAQSAGQSQSHPSQDQPEVYIMSSPSGPQAILLANNSTYYTAQPVLQPQPYPAWYHSPRGFPAPPQNLPAFRQRRTDNQPQQGLPRPPVANNQVNPAIDLHQHRGPPNVGAAAVLAAIWPHVWLLVRLAAFVWWFTASDSSWSRWITVMIMAIGVFAINTGLFNNIAHQAWDPFRRHLEGLLLPGARHPDHPVAAAPEAAANPADPNRANPAAAAAYPAGQQQQQQQPAAGHNPDPAEAAARLVARRQQHNANWVMTQIRRVERAGLLFLASIAPGVAERHIAHLEAQERTAREEAARREAEATQAAQTQAQAQTEGAQTQTEGGAQHTQAQGQGQTQAPPARDRTEAGGQEQGHAPQPQGEVGEPAAAQRQEGPLIEV